MAKYGTQEDEGTPLSQQTFGEQRSTAVHAPLPNATYVSGVGVLGIDIEGYAKGDKMAQEYRLNENADARSEETLGLAKEQFGLNKDYLSIAQQDLGIRLENHENDMEEFGWKRDDRDRDMRIQQGMTQAADQGGYEGVINFLKVTDPKKAIAFHAEKLKLDSAIMSNETMKTVSMNDKPKALLESYGILGKVSMAMLNAKPEDRDNMFKTISPLLKQVMGDNAPQTLEEFVPIGMLSVAQATSENQISLQNKNLAALETEEGNTTLAIQQLAAKGLTPENDQLAADLNNKLKAMRASNQKAQEELTVTVAKKGAEDMRKAKDEGALRAQQMSADKQFTDRYRIESKDTGEFLTQKVNFDAAYQSYKSGKGGAASETALMRTVAMMFNKGALGDADVTAFAGSDSALLKLVKNTRSLYEKTGAITLNATEVDRLKDLMDNMHKAKSVQQKTINEKFKKLGQTYKINEDVISYYPTMEEKPEMPQYSNLELQKLAEEQIAKTPEKKDQILKKLQMLQQQQGKQ